MNRLTRMLMLVSLIFIAAETHFWADRLRTKPITVETLSPPRENPASPLDPRAATDAYLAKIPPDKKKRSDAYFEGGYWLLLWNFLYGGAVLWLLLRSRWSSRLRNAAERITPIRPLQTALYLVEFVFVTSLLMFPLTVYEHYVREHQYGLSTQRFGSWFADYLKGIMLSIILGSFLVVAVFGVIRRARDRWWVWGSMVVIFFLVFVQMVAPLYIFPLFNRYTKLVDEKGRDPILSMARANGISVNDVYQVDASRQSTRISANVSGFLGTERITLNDNLLKRCSLAEIKSVMGHEMGHYVLNHIYKGLLFFSIWVVLAFAFLSRSLDWSVNRWGAMWGVRGVDDVAVLPLALLFMSLFFLLLMPVVNTYIRTVEYEADLFGLNASREPDEFAEVSLKLGEYRKLDPSPVDEWIFFDHPSGRTRIYAAMRWKAESLRAPEDLAR